MGQLAEPELAEFEEHLLLCEHCQERLAREDDIRQGMRDAATVLEQPRPATGWTVHKLAWGFGLAVVAFLAAGGFLYQYSHKAVPPSAVVVLQTVRGNASQPVVAPGKPVILVLDLTGLPPFPTYQCEVVDSTGSLVFRAGLVAHDSKLQAPFVRGFTQGTYFVRVSSPAHDLLREFALTVRG